MESETVAKVGPKEFAQRLNCSVRSARRWLAVMHERHPEVVHATGSWMRRRRYWIADWRQFVRTLEDAASQ